MIIGVNSCLIVAGQGGSTLTVMLTAKSRTTSTVRLKVKTGCTRRVLTPVTIQASLVVISPVPILMHLSVKCSMALPFISPVRSPDQTSDSSRAHSFIESTDRHRLQAGASAQLSVLWPLVHDQQFARE